MWSFQWFCQSLSCSWQHTGFTFTRYRECFSVHFSQMHRIFTSTYRKKCFFPFPFPQVRYFSLGEKREKECGWVVLFSLGCRYSSPKAWTTNGSISLLSPVFSCELLWVEPVSGYVFSLYLWPLWFLYSFAGLHTTLTNSLIFLPEFLLLSGYICPRYVNAHLLSFTADTCHPLDFRLVVFPVTSNLWPVVENLRESKIVPRCWLVWL